MAQASKRLKRERRERRKITINKLFPVLQRNFGLEARVRELEAFVKQANSGAAAARVLVMGLLAQAGGKLEVTAGTLQQAQQNAPNLGWTVKPKEGDDQTYVVTLVEGQEPQAEQTPEVLDSSPSEEIHEEPSVLGAGGGISSIPPDDDRPEYYDEPSVR